MMKDEETRQNSPWHRPPGQVKGKRQSEAPLGESNPVRS
jgi:hypothetical protein